MPRPTSLLPALVAAATVTGLVVGAAPATAAPTPWVGGRSVPASAPTAPGDSPLRVTIEQLTPGYVPEKGRIELAGTVTNTTDEQWRAINVHAFVDDAPLTSAAEVAGTQDIPEDALVGDRLQTPGTFVGIGNLGPGETASYSISLRRSDLPISSPGVYWFGAHALGNTDEGRDEVADGRARTLLPLVPSGSGTEEGAIVVPVRHSIRHAPDGRLRSARRWARDLSVGGRLRELVDLGAAAGSTPVTWLVDPAVPDAVARLVAGNPSRTLADPGAVQGEPGGRATGDDEQLDSEVVEPGEPTEESEEAPPPNVAAGPGSIWLDRFESALLGDEVLTLPYGDPDVAAVEASAPHFYDQAVRRGGTELERWRVRGTPAVAPPSGYLPADALSVLDGEETVLLGDQALEEGTIRASAQVDGARVLFSSAQTAEGGPGPGDPLDDIALRQRFLAEAATRLLFHGRTPVLLTVPESFAPDSSASFWEGLQDVPWLELTDTASLPSGGPLAADGLDYPSSEELRQLDPDNFTVAEQLVERGAVLDSILPGTETVAAQTVDEALTSLSYSEQAQALESRIATGRSVEWIQRRLDKVRVRAPRGVTLSSNAGEFAPTVTNRLDQPVRVQLRTKSLGAVEVEDSDVIELAPGGRQTVLLAARATAQGVQYVRVQVTAEDGTPLGAAQRVAIRSAEVSRVIWLILGTGVGLLFLAIAIRLVRRVRRERGGATT
ncbi:hypothetical protein GCM10009623_18670 [Nocardioides aestuarii]|uniref:DUF6049 family protein n=1 Tax=Nocardioides aestuarii TaxID=252231 RepID=A0ABW4TMM7_9ACTN